MEITGIRLKGTFGEVPLPRKPPDRRPYISMQKTQPLVNTPPMNQLSRTTPTLRPYIIRPAKCRVSPSPSIIMYHHVLPPSPAYTESTTPHWNQSVGTKEHAHTILWSLPIITPIIKTYCIHLDSCI
ncbi:hypothetical protein M405DRAFT_827643 [Rhizopogon salebrosus TDB-379]|nr:hypothetical protein M405DRAFT_827643 [Rhizopogon salebrosus TDB-379]